MATMKHDTEDIKNAVNNLKNQLVLYKRIGQAASNRLVITKKQIEKSRERQVTIDEKILRTRTRYMNLKKRLDAFQSLS